MNSGNTIKERAKEEATWIEIDGLKYIPRVDTRVYNACVRMAREQRKIDAEHAWDIIEKRFDKYFGEEESTEKYIMFKTYFINRMMEE